MIRRVSLSILMLILASFIAQAQEVSTKPNGSSYGSLESKVDKLFAQWEKPDSPGAALIVVKDGSVI